MRACVLGVRRKWFLVVIAVCVPVVLFSQHKASRVDNRPEWLQSWSPTCQPHSKISFLKTHKCASSTIQNILFRYGEAHNLLFALPRGNYFGGGTRYVSKPMIEMEVPNKFGFDIFAIHGTWNITYMRSMMPPDTLFITIVRDPAELFFSLFSYTDLGRTLNYSLEDYINKVGVNDRQKGFLGFNQMLWDFGLPKGHFNDSQYIDSVIAEADSTFHLVMVAERMPESLILLSKLVCAPLGDMVTLKLNARQQSKRPVLDSKTHSALKRKLEPDYRLYNHFSRKFDALVKAYGEERMAQDIAQYDHLLLSVQEKCGFAKTGQIKATGLPVGLKEKVEVFQSHSHDGVCVAMTTPELTYLDNLRMRQRRKVMKEAMKKGLPTNDLIGGIPLSPNDIIGGIPLGQNIPQQFQKFV